MSCSFILGGVRSGKSLFAEGLALQSKKKLLYVATAQAFDSEMASRIEAHKKRRGEKNSGGWQTIEEPLALVDILRENVNNENCILVDCLTLWLNNLMMADKHIKNEISTLANFLSSNNGDIIFVSNEVGQGIVPLNRQARQFCDYAGMLHQEIAAVAKNVWWVVAGVPQKIK